MGLGERFKHPREIMAAGDRKKPNMIIIWIIIAGIIILIFGDFDTANEDISADTEISFQTETYEKAQEARLEKILKKINGAGEVSVFISIDGGGEKILARDNKIKISKGEEDEKAVVNYDEENESVVVMSGKGSLEEPYVTEEKPPRIGGVLVVAKGASDEKVRLEIYEAVKAVYGISPHRIRITY